MSLKADFYDEAYYDGGKGYTKYDYSGQYDEWAGKIIKYYHPRAVLDVGCAKGFLVKALRDRGVEAFGVDISTYAIANALESVKPFLVKQDITDTRFEYLPFYKSMDLCVSFDTFEHIPEDKLLAAKEFMRSVSPRWFIRVATKNTPNWQHDESHITIHSLGWWKEWWPEADFEESK